MIVLFDFITSYVSYVQRELERSIEHFVFNFPFYCRYDGYEYQLNNGLLHVAYTEKP
jgi:hypothetical protein